MRKIWDSEPVRFVREIVELYFSAHVSRSAAELAYFLILTVFPLLICINAFVGALHLDISAVLDSLAEFLPASVISVVADYIQYITVNQSFGMFLAGLFVTLVSASAAVRALMKIMDDIYGRTNYPGFWSLVVSVVFSILLLITMYLSIVVVLTGNWFFHLVERYLHLQNLLTDWQWMRFVILFALVLLFILLLYRVTAPIGKPRPPVLTGAVLASVALVAASILFSMFIGMSSRYSLVYGSLASVIILLVWLYLCGNILILGNVFNCVWYRRKKKRYDARKKS
ncbi:MAG: YihY/virulence factor BrkB family protein [Oscillospiraceae bacterium]